MMKKEKKKIKILLFLLPILIFIGYFSYCSSKNIKPAKLISEDIDELRIQTRSVKKIINEILPNVSQDKNLLSNKSTDYNNKYFTNLRNPFITSKLQKKHIGEPNSNSEKAKNAKNYTKLISNRTNNKQKNITGDFNLMGIIYDKTKPSAIINNEIYYEGDIIKNSQIIKITNKGVTLKSGKKNIFLPAPQFE